MKDGQSRIRIPAGIWALGFVSMFMDASSELIHSLLPVFIVSVLGSSAVAVGLIDGLGQAVAAAARVFSGVKSDRLGRRKGLTVLGYALAAFSKPLFALAPGVGLVILGRVIDRTGKGVRGAPRDALISAIAPKEIRATCFGLRQSLDTVGALAGGVGAVVLMVLLAQNIRAVYWFATVPALLAVVLLIVMVKEPEAPDDDPAASESFSASVRNLGAPYWWVFAMGAVLLLARFSEGFLVLMARERGLGLTFIPVVFVVLNVTYAISAYPAGRLADRFGRRALLGSGFVMLALADGMLAAATSIGMVLLAVAVWGLHMGFTQGLFSAMIADVAPRPLLGTAFGMFHLMTGVVLLIASLAAGLLWENVGSQAPFWAGIVPVSVGLTLLVLHGSIASDLSRN